MDDIRKHKRQVEKLAKQGKRPSSGIFEYGKAKHKALKKRVSHDYPTLRYEGGKFKNSTKQADQD